MELNRPDKRNALNEDLVAALHDAIGDAAVDPHVRVIVIRGAGNDFCSGADLAALEKIAEMGAEGKPDRCPAHGRSLCRHPDR